MSWLYACTCNISLISTRLWLLWLWLGMFLVQSVTRTCLPEPPVGLCLLKDFLHFGNYYFNFSQSAINLDQDAKVCWCALFRVIHIFCTEKWARLRGQRRPRSDPGRLIVVLVPDHRGRTAHDRLPKVPGGRRNLTRPSPPVMYSGLRRRNTGGRTWHCARSLAIKTSTVQFLLWLCFPADTESDRRCGTEWGWLARLVCRAWIISKISQMCGVEKLLAGLLRCYT